MGFGTFCVTCFQDGGLQQIALFGKVHAVLINGLPTEVDIINNVQV